MKRTTRIMLYTAVVGILTGISVWFLHSRMNDLALYSIAGAANLLAYIYLFVHLICQDISIPRKIAIALLTVIPSPAILYIIGCILSPTFFFSAFLQLYTPFGITISLLLYEAILERSARKKCQANSSGQSTCVHCGAVWPSEQLFCPQCGNLSPEVPKSLTHNSTKHHLDFSFDVRHGYLYCPHCGIGYGRTTDLGATAIGSPLTRCRQCGDYFIDRSLYEWAVLPTSKKLEICFLNGKCKFTLVVLLYFLCTGVIESNSPVFVLCILAVMVILRIVWFQTITISDIQQSELRLKNNPEYPQILADMGYIDLMDSKYIALLKTKREELL